MRHRICLFGTALILAVALAGCGGDASGTGPQACAPGQTIACACSGGQSSVQTCNALGSGYDACQCLDASPSDGPSEAAPDGAELDGADVEAAIPDALPGDAVAPDAGEDALAEAGQDADAAPEDATSSDGGEDALPDAVEDAVAQDATADAVVDAEAQDAPADAAEDVSGEASIADAAEDAIADVSGDVQDAASEGGQVQCDDALKRCAHVFAYPVGSETTVEVRGTFTAIPWNQIIAMQRVGGYWTVSADLPWGVDTLYKYVIDGTTWVSDPTNANVVSDGFGGFNSVVANVSCASWTCAAPPPVNDWQDAVMYFAFVDRFSDGYPSNNGSPVAGVSTAGNYQGGDFKGVQNKIESGYFGELGVNAIWLTVPVDNADGSGLGTDGRQYSAYHGYWPKNLDTTEPRFGSVAELKSVVDAAHAKGIRIILDYAMNHVHVEAPVYQQHPDWFWPSDLGGQSCICGSSACPWDGPTAKRCWFTDYLPDFDFTNAAARKYSVDNVLWWMQQSGADGLRLDAVKHVEDAWLTDLRVRLTTDIEPVTKHHVYLVGETFTGDKTLIKSYVRESMLDGQFDFPLRLQVISSLLTRTVPMTELASFLDGNDGYYGASAVMSTFVGNHDLPRSIHFAQDVPISTNAWYDGKDRAWTNQPGVPSELAAFERMGNAYTLLFTTKGVPMLYYGDEVGMAGAGDPDNRRMMQWSGYSSGQQALLAHVKRLGQLRATLPALRQGTRTTLAASTDTLVYRMSTASQTVYVAINRSDSAQQVSNLPASPMIDRLTSAGFTGSTVTVPARSALILTAP